MWFDYSMKFLNIISRSRNPVRNCMIFSRGLYHSGDSGQDLRNKLSGFQDQSRYSIEEENQIIQTLNKSSTDELNSRFNIGRVCSESIKKFCNIQGHFHSLDQVLQVEGLGERKLELICDRILASSESGLKEADEVQDNAKKKTKSNAVKKGANRYHMVIPAMNGQQRNTLKTAVGVHIAGDTATWASLSREGELLHWDICALPFGHKKPHPTALLEMALCLKELLPKGDVYVLEDAPQPTQSLQQKFVNVFTNLQYSQLKAMLLTILNTENNSLPSIEKEEQSPLQCHKVFYLRSRLPARFFKLLVGSERVSAQTAVNRILSISPKEDTSDIWYSPIVVNSDLKQAYMERSSIEKENLCRALLVTMTFMDLIVRITPESVKCFDRIK